MALVFPTSPSDGDVYENYVWNDTVGAWQINDYTAKIINTDGDSGKTIYVGSIDPSVFHSPVAGDVWIEVSS